jgi:membrane protease subunit HflC
MAASRIFMVLITLGVLVLITSFFIVDERQLAIKFQLGEIVDSEYEPGLHFMKPLFINNVRKFDKRILTLDTRPERFLTGEKKNVNVDFFIKWRIKDPAIFYTSFGGDERQASLRLLQIINNGLQLEFDHRTIKEVVATERAEMMDNLTAKGNEEVQKFGIEIVDVRIKQIELPEDVRASVFQRMRAERNTGPRVKRLPRGYGRWLKGSAPYCWPRRSVMPRSSAVRVMPWRPRPTPVPTVRMRTSTSFTAA